MLRVAGEVSVENKCPNCGAAMKQYWQRLTPGLVGVLVKFRTAVIRKGVNKLHVPRDLDLSKTEYNNFQKLRYHGLVAKFRVNGIHDQGYWLLTRRGASFLKGDIQIPSKVKTYRNRVIDHAGELVTVKDVLGITPYFETISDIEFEVAVPEIGEQTALPL